MASVSLAALRTPLRVFGWLLRYTARLAPRQLSSTALLYLLASFLEIATLGAIVIAVRAIDPEQSVGVSFVDDWIGSGNGTLVAVGTLLFATQALAAALSYLSARAVRKLGRLVNHTLVQGLIAAVGDRTSDLSGLAEQANRHELGQTASRDTKIAGLALLTVFSLSKSIILLVIYGWAMATINPGATLALVPVGLVTIPFALVQARRVQSFSRDFYMSSALGYGLQVQDQLARADALSPIGATSDGTEREYRLEGTDVDKFYNDYDQVLLANEQTQLGATAVQGLAIAVALGVLGRAALDGDIAYSTVLVYVLAVSRAAGHARTAASHMTNLVRYNPMIRRLYGVMHSQDRPDLSAAAAASFPPAKTVIATRGALGRLEVARIRRGLASLDHGLPDECVIFVGAPEIAAIRLGELVRPVSDDSFADLLPSPRLSLLASDGGFDWDYDLSGEGWAELPQALKAASLFLRAKHLGQPLLISVGQTEGLDDKTWIELEPLTSSVPSLAFTEGRPVRSQRFEQVFVAAEDGTYSAVPFEAWSSEQGASGGSSLVDELSLELF